MRLALLHISLSGYFAACLRELKARTGAELLLYVWPADAAAPFDPGLFADLGVLRNRHESSDAEILAAVRAFRPDAVLTSGWIDPGYLKICRALRRDGIPVVAGVDTQWTGSLRQRVASWVAPWYLGRSIDVLWVPGERQAVLGRALGYSGKRLWDGIYACDWGHFAPPPGAPAGPAGGNRAFLYVGRYVPEKGLDTLAAAYREYRRQVDDPWKLVCAGTGPEREALVAAGAEDRGFVQPSDLPALMRQASAFVLPSRFEPWGVVVHEAATTGLPLILSDACGAGAHLLRDHFNGMRFPAGDAAALTRALLALHALPPESLRAYGHASHELSRQYTPELWVRTLCEGLAQLPPAGR